MAIPVVLFNVNDPSYFSDTTLWSVTSADLISNKPVDEMDAFQQVLNEIEDTRLGLLFIKSNAVTLWPVENLYQFLRTLNEDYDVVYLGRYQDNCSLYRKVGTYGPLILYETELSNGSFALYFTSRGVAKLKSRLKIDAYDKNLSQNISANVYERHLRALTTDPVIFNYREEISSAQPDWLKTQPCKAITAVDTYGKIKSNAEPIAWWWFIIVMAGIISLACIVYLRN